MWDARRGVLASVDMLTSSALGAGGSDGRAGALYRCPPGVRGLEPLVYQG